MTVYRVGPTGHLVVDPDEFFGLDEAFYQEGWRAHPRVWRIDTAQVREEFL
jgi:hypothetical protein